MNGPAPATPTPQHPGTPLPYSSLEDKLRLAASKGQEDKVKELLESGATCDPDKDGRTALQYAALNGHGEICKLLLKQNYDKDVEDGLGYTAVHRAASRGHLEVVEILAEAGCSVNCQDKNGNTALHEAAWNGFSKTVEMLVKHNANSFVCNKGGFTALHLAAQNGHNESCRVLLYAACDSDLKNNYGDTALHTAARYGHAGVTRILLSARCKINEQNKNGDTGLHIAAALKRRKIAKLLVEGGIDVQITNKQNETAMDVARRKEHPEIIIIIQSFARPKTPKSPRPPTRTHNVTFKDEIEVDGPVVVPHEDPPKPEKPEKERRFFFFKKKKKEKDKTPQKFPGGGQVAPQGDNSTPGEPWRPVQGFFSQYIPKGGIQYYRDLAGNIKQGPVGYTPLCQCGPTMKRLEQKVETQRGNLVDHVNASTQLLKGQIDHIDKRTTQQVYAIDKLTKERLENEHKLCNNRISVRLRHERHDTEQMFNQYNEQIQNWLDSKLASYGHCLNHHHDDSALPPQNFFTDVHENENGRLFKSRSDETLSVSDYSGKHRKKDFYESRQEAMQLIRAWQVPQYRQSARKRDRTINNNNMTITKAEIHGNMDRVADGASPKYEGSPSRLMSANSPVDVSAIKRETGSHGAIPKRLPHSHSWQNPGLRSREGSPQVTGMLRSREGSPLDVRSSLRPVHRSHTESSNLHSHTSMPKQNLPERGPPDTKNKPGAPEVPPKPNKPSTGPKPNPGMFNRPSSVGADLHNPGFVYQANRSSQQNNQNYMYLEDPSFPKYKPRTRSTDTLLIDDNDGFDHRVTRSKSLERTLDDGERTVPASARPALDRNMNQISGPTGPKPGPQIPDRAVYRLHPSGGMASASGSHRQVTAPNYSNQSQNAVSQHKESPYASAREMQRIAQSVRMTTPSPRPGFQSYDASNRQIHREGNYSDGSQYNKATHPHRSMYGINNDSGNYANYASVPMRNPISKSEVNLATNYERVDKPHPNQPPPYEYRRSDLGAKSPNMQKNSAIVNSQNVNSFVKGQNNVPIRTGSVTPVSGQYGGSRFCENYSVHNHVNNRNSLANNHADLVGNHGNIIGNHSNNVNLVNGNVSNHGNLVNGHVMNHTDNSQDSYNLAQSECLRHDSVYPRTSVYNPSFQNSKEDSTCSSNQDSGYSSKAKFNGQSPDRLPSNSGTPSSSFSMDRSISNGTPSHNYSSQNNSSFSQTSSPFTPVIATSSPFSAQRESTPAFNYSIPTSFEQTPSPPRPAANIQAHVNGWYQKKLLEAAAKLRKSEQYNSDQSYGPVPIKYDPVNGSDV